MIIFYIFFTNITHPQCVIASDTHLIGLHSCSQDGHIAAREIGGGAHKELPIGLQQTGAVRLRMKWTLDHAAVHAGDCEVLHLQEAPRVGVNGASDWRLQRIGHELVDMGDLDDHSPGATNSSAGRRSSHTRTAGSHRSCGARAHSCDTIAPTGLLPGTWRSPMAWPPSWPAPAAPGRKTCGTGCPCKESNQMYSIIQSNQFNVHITMLK